MANGIDASKLADWVEFLGLDLSNSVLLFAIDRLEGILHGRRGPL